MKCRVLVASAWAMAVNLAPLPSLAADVAPAAIAGTWDVMAVQVDREDSMHALYQEGDPRLVGRSLSIEAEKVVFSYGKDIDCQQTHWPRWKTQWGTLFRQAFRRAPLPGLSAHPSIQDFHLEARKDQPVTAYSLCPAPKDSPATRADGIWVIQYQNDKLLLRMDPQFLLLLARRPPDAKPTVASFDCPSANKPSEKTICRDYDLASWDRSVSRALQQYLEARPEKKSDAQRAQAEYEHRRDACGTNVECIGLEQSSRVDELVQLKNLP